MFAQMGSGGLSPLPSLAVAASLSAAPLHSLYLEMGNQRAADLRQSSSHLSGIPKLALDVCPEPSLAAVLRELLPRLPRLADLAVSRSMELSRASMRAMMGDQVPTEDATVAAASSDALQVLAGQRGLTRLALRFWELRHLPDTLAPCLPGKRGLSGVAV